MLMAWGVIYGFASLKSPTGLCGILAKPKSRCGTDSNTKAHIYSARRSKICLPP
ncbi:MAG: hypothetical protein HAW65_04050 [Alphaproteobacteria bacterium]|nr:hypothetical protein [Alphaproteobacteria bacterium]